MSDEKKFEWPELPYHRAILKNKDTDAEGRIIAAQQIHAGIMHGVGGDSRDARAPKQLAHELTRELCVTLGENTPEILAREIVWQVAHIFHEGTDARFYPPEEDEKELATVVMEQLQHEHIRSLVRHWVLQTLEMGTKKEFASSLSHARSMSEAVGIELAPAQEEEIRAAEIRYWEDRRTRYIDENEQNMFDEQLREHGQVPVSYLIDRIHEHDLTCIDNSSKGTVLGGLSFLAGMAEPLAASGLERIAVPIPHNMQERLSDAIRCNDMLMLKKMLIEGDYATHMLHEYGESPSFDSYVESQMEALQSISEHLQIVCVGADLGLEQDGGSSLDQQVAHLSPLLKRGKLLYSACVPFVSTAFPKSRQHLTGTHSSWPCSTQISLPIMAARAFRGSDAHAPFCIQLAESWQFDESFSLGIDEEGLAEIFAEFTGQSDPGEKFRNFTPRVRKPPYRIRRSVGVDVEKTLLAQKNLLHHQENFGEAYDGVVILVDNEREDDRDQKHIHADMPGEGQRKEEFAAI